MMMVSETEEVVGMEAQCGPVHQDPPKSECNGTKPPKNLDDNSYVFDIKDASVDSGEVNGNDNGKAIQDCVGDEEAENQIGGSGLAAESNNNSAVVEECELRGSLDLESKSIDGEEERSVVECELPDTKVELSEGEAVEIAKPQVPSSTSLDLDLESSPINTKEATDVDERELENVSLKKSSGGAVAASQQHEVPKSTSSSPIKTVDVAVGVVEPESQGVSVKTTEDDEVKLSEGEVVGIAEHEVPSSTSLDLNLEPKQIDTKEEVDVVGNVVECDLQDTSVKAENEVVENAEHEGFHLKSIPINTKENIVDVVDGAVERESQDPSMKAEDGVKLSDEVVENAENEALDLESNTVNAKLSGEVVKNAEREILNTELSGEVVKNAELQDLNLKSIPINTKENIVGVVADVGEHESQDPSMKGDDEVKSSDEVFENAEHEILGLESNPVNAKLSSEVVKNAEREILDLESNPVNVNEEIDVVDDVVERESQDLSLKSEDEVKLSDEVVENAEHKILGLESNPVNAKLSSEVVKNTELEDSIPINTKENIVDVAADVERESQDPSVKAEDEVKLSDGVVENAEHETLGLESNPVNAKLSGEVIKNAEREILDLEPNPVYANEEVDVVAGVVGRESQDLSLKSEDEVKLSDEVAENAEHQTLGLESNPVNAKLSGEVIKSAEREILDLEPNPVYANEEVDVVADVVGRESQDLSLKSEDEVKLSDEVAENAEHKILGLESNPVYANEEVDVVADVVGRESQDLILKSEDEVKLSDEVVENAKHKIVGLKSNPVYGNEEVDVVADVVERESQDLSLKSEGEVKLSDEVVENSEHKILGLESNPVKDKLSGEMVKNAELEDSIPINTKGNIVDVVADIVERESQDPSAKAEAEVKLSNGVVENAEHETLGLQSNPVNAKLLLDEVVKNEEREILDLESNLVNINEEIDVVADVIEHESQDRSMKAEDGVKLSGGVFKNAEHKILDLESNSVNAKLSCEVVRIAELEDLNLKSIPINTKENIVDVVANVVEHESQDPSVKAEDEVNLSNEVVENAEHKTLGLESNPVNAKLSGEVVHNADCGILDLESNPMNTNEEIDVVADVEHESQDRSMKAEDEVKLLSGGVVENAEHIVILEHEDHVRNFSAISSRENSRDVNKKGAANNIELEIEAVEDKLVQIVDENLVLRENDTGNSRDNNTPVAPPKVEEASVKTKRKSFNFLVRVPRFDNESLREQIRLAKINVDEKTKLRDAIQVQIQEKRASTQIHGIDYEYAKGESRNARKLVRLKRIEIDSLQSVINKAKNALSIGDIDSQIYNMEHMIQHETLPLKEEKQLIREIKQLKQLREQLSSNMGSKDEIKQALEQREEVEERLKILRKELDSLKDKVVKAETAAVEAEKKYDAENKKVKEIQAQFRAVDDVRQSAYIQWQSLRKELSKKSEYFYKYKDDSAVASNCVFSRDTDALYRLCTNNVEKFMELWNTNDEFRRDYVKFNTRSTIWRLGTLDGRSLGPDEVPPVLPTYVDTRVNRNVSTPSKVDLKSQFPALEPKQGNITQSVIAEGNSTKKLTEEKNRRVTNKEPAISVQTNGSDTVPGEDIIINGLPEEPKKSKEEIETIKKVEERERKEADAKLKEERRLEALAKASEARERKKRQAEKLQMRAEMKTIKEAEQKEKEREKRLRKKERKKAAATDVNDTNGSELAPSSESAAETSKDVEVKDASSVAAPKKHKKHWLFGKQSKAKSTIPPPLRNRNKKKLQQWMWVGITSFVILVLFWLGNMGVFSNVQFKRRSPVL